VSGSAYVPATFDLAVNRDGPEFVSSSQANPVAAVKALIVPSTAFLHLGASGAPIPLVEGETYEVCAGEPNGIGISNPRGAGLLLLALFFAGGAVVPRTAGVFGYPSGGFWGANNPTAGGPAPPFHNVTQVQNPLTAPRRVRIRSILLSFQAAGLYKLFRISSASFVATPADGAATDCLGGPIVAATDGQLVFRKSQPASLGVTAAPWLFVAAANTNIEVFSRPGSVGKSCTLAPGQGLQLDHPDNVNSATGDVQMSLLWDLE
jgi:hypothetical protein